MQIDHKKLRIVDSREPEEIRHELLKMGWTQQRLDYGDFMFWGCHQHCIGITRKTTNDFINSINDKFGSQLEAMLEHFDICIMLIELPWNWNSNSKIITSNGISRITREAALNYIHRWQAKGFILERTVDIHDTVIRLNELYALYQHPYSLSARSKGYADERLLALPSGVRGSSGENVLKCFGSLAKIANADAENFIGIEGIGKKKADLIYNHFHRGNNE